jgi:hypothetical protein
LTTGRWSVTDSWTDATGHRGKMRPAIVAVTTGNSMTVATGHRFPMWKKFSRIIRSNTFELIFAFLILSNGLLLTFEAQYRGAVDGVEAQLLPGADPAANWTDAEDAFAFFGMAFGIAFTVELLLKMVAYHIYWPLFFWNWFDLIIVVGWIADSSGVRVGLNPMVMRTLVGLGKAARMARLGRTVVVFESLHMLFAALEASFCVAMWSLLIIFVLTSAAALVMTSLTKPFYLDMENDVDDRLNIYLYFGTFTRALLSMVEVSIGNWAPIIRTVQENVSGWLAFGLLLYQLVVGFSMIKVVLGVFLMETFKVTENDDEVLIEQNRRKVARMKAKMRELFLEADLSMDGNLSRNEFMQAVQDDRMRNWLSSLGLDMANIEAAWDIMDDDGDGLTLEELIKGVQRVKGPARALDLAVMQLQQDRLFKVVVGKLPKSPIPRLGQLPAPEHRESPKSSERREFAKSSPTVEEGATDDVPPDLNENEDNNVSHDI